MKFKKHMPFNFQKKEYILKALLFKGEEQQRLFKYARQKRDEVFSKRVEVRSVIEYSNLCKQKCNYCGMNIKSRLKRYILNDRDFLKRIDRLYSLGRRVIMVQAGECDSENYFNKLFELLKEIKESYSDLTLICSLGNLSKDKYKKLKHIGIDRYLLKFETSDPAFYRRVKPSDTLKNRLEHIKLLKKIGFDVSSGNITGLPGQTLKSLVNDLLLLKELDLPMGSTSIFIPNELSAYANFHPGDMDITLNFMAILRIICPDMVIPATSSMELVKKGGQYLGLLAGANSITLHDGTPKKCEERYIIYKKNRYRPKEALFKILKKAKLQPCLTSLIRKKFKDTLYYKLVNKNTERDKIAVYCDNFKYTYKYISVLVSKFCTFLKKHNIKEGDVVLLSLFDSIEFVVALLSCIRLGIIIAPVDPQSNKEEWKFILSNTRPDYIFTTHSVCNKLRGKKVLKIADDDSPLFFLSLVKKQTKSDSFAGVDKNNPALILYTSGTTGRPKGVMHTYKDLFADNFPRTVLKITAKDIIFSSSKMHTGFGLGNSLFFPFHFAASVILSRSVPNEFLLRRISALKPTLFFASPSMFEYILHHKETFKGCFNSVRIFISSGDKLYSDISKDWQVNFKSKILDCFGSTEMFHPFISNFPGKEKLNSCGKIVEGFKIKFDENQRMYSKGPTLSAGYYNDSKLTQERMIRGWFKSDDLGYMNKSGDVFFIGRRSSVFKLSGKWVSSLDIENKVRKLRMIKDIVVIKKGNRLNYYLSLKKGIYNGHTEKRIRRFCLKHLKIQELPKDIFILDEIAKTKSGKVDREKLKIKIGEE